MHAVACIDFFREESVGGRRTHPGSLEEQMPTGPFRELPGHVLLDLEVLPDLAHPLAVLLYLPLVVLLCRLDHSDLARL